MTRQELTIEHIERSQEFIKYLSKTYPNCIDSIFVDYIINDLEQIKNRVKEL